MKRKITLILGDGVGPEVINSAKDVISALTDEIEWEIWDAGEKAFGKYGTYIPEGLIESIKRNKVALKGPITTPIGKGFRSVNVQLRKDLDLFCCLRPCKFLAGVKTRLTNPEKVDLVIIRENHEDLYSGIEFKALEDKTRILIKTIKDINGQEIREDSGISIKAISKTASRRIIKFAFDYAKKYKRKKVTLVHKANIMKFTDGLFLEEGLNIAKEHSEIEFEDKVVDNMCMQLVQKPELYDVLVLPNLYGDIISDLAAGLVGGLGIAPSANLGEEIALFEPIHGSAPKYAGKNVVNPTATILSASMMLKHIGEFEKANIIEKAVENVIRDGKFVTYDLKSSSETPPATTSQMTDAIINEIEKLKW